MPPKALKPTQEGSEQAHFRPLRKRLCKALEILAETGCSKKEAAERAGMKPNSLTVALSKVHVREELERVMRARLDLERSRSWAAVLKLRDEAASEDVQLKAARTHLDAMGELTGGPQGGDKQPNQLIQIVTQHVQIGAAPYERLPGVVEAPPMGWRADEETEITAGAEHPLFRVVTRNT